MSSAAMQQAAAASGERSNDWHDVALDAKQFDFIEDDSHYIPTVLIVDDNEVNRMILADHLELMGLNHLVAQNGAEALDIIRRDSPDLVLLDLMMPVMDGHTLLGTLQSDDALKKVPVIVVSGKDDEDSVVNCIERGAVDYLVKPFRPRVLKARIENSLARTALARKESQLGRVIAEYNRELRAEVNRQVRVIAQAHVSTVFALSTLAESRDPETGDHLDRIRVYCRLLASALGQMGIDESSTIDDRFVETLYAASPLHDIGKVAIPDNVLLNPGKLSAEEFEIMKGHCEFGANTLRTVIEEFPDNDLIQMGIEVAQGHHEKWDGSGYPHGAAGLDIPLSCRIVALCDVYDALTSKRCYKEAFSHQKSRDIIVAEKGKHFDPNIADAFVLCEQEFNAIRVRLQPAAQ
jgi:putative two-component system response regulator